MYVEFTIYAIAVKPFLMFLLSVTSHLLHNYGVVMTNDEGFSAASLPGVN